MTTALLAAVGASPAKATLDISFSDGLGHTFTCADQTSCDLDGAAKNLLLINTIVGNFRIEGTFAASTSGKLNDLSVSNLTIFNNGATTGHLQMVLGDTGFSPPVSFTRESASLTFNNDTGGDATLAFFGDTANGQPAGPGLNIPGVELFSATGAVTTSPFSFAGTHDSAFSASSPFSLTETASLGMVPGSTITGFNLAMESGIPEPKTWALMAIGFGLLGLMGVRRSRKNRLATFA
jgi:hypothetical protein